MRMGLHLGAITIHIISSLFTTLYKIVHLKALNQSPGYDIKIVYP